MNIISSIPYLYNLSNNKGGNTDSKIARNYIAVIHLRKTQGFILALPKNWIFSSQNKIQIFQGFFFNFPNFRSRLLWNSNKYGSVYTIFLKGGKYWWKNYKNHKWRYKHNKSIIVYLSHEISAKSYSRNMKFIKVNFVFSNDGRHNQVHDHTINIK